ncbi:MAG: DUF3634 family protein [Candidatus Sericytochromatia bacterium]|nr:DUF3634 family protein [Candidatus Sericytochromatia bacterium]
MFKKLRFLFYRLAQQPCFVLHIHQGQIQLQQGQVSQAFLSACQDIVDLYALQQGLIMGLKREEYIQLRFYDLPAKLQQNFRNIWENS